MEVRCSIIGIDKNDDKEILFVIPVEVVQINQNNISGHKTIPTVITKVIDKIMTTNIPEEIDANREKYKKIKFSIVGNGINIEFDANGKIY